MSKDKDTSSQDTSSFGACIRDNAIDAMARANDNCHSLDADCTIREASYHLAETCITGGSSSHDSGSGGGEGCVIA